LSHTDLYAQTEELYPEDDVNSATLQVKKNKIKKDNKPVNKIESAIGPAIELECCNRFDNPFTYRLSYTRILTRKRLGLKLNFGATHFSRELFDVSKDVLSFASILVIKQIKLGRKFKYEYGAGLSSRTVFNLFDMDEISPGLEVQNNLSYRLTSSFSFVSGLQLNTGDYTFFERVTISFMSGLAFEF
jgi:hypothetical protein